MLISVVASIILTSNMVTSAMFNIDHGVVGHGDIDGVVYHGYVNHVDVDHGHVHHGDVDHRAKYECHWEKIQQTNANGKRSKALPICQIYLYYAKFDLFSSESLLNRMGKEH